MEERVRFAVEIAFKLTLFVIAVCYGCIYMFNHKFFWGAVYIAVGNLIAFRTVYVLGPNLKEKQ